MMTKHGGRYYPGTLQLCSVCGVPTERCEEDALLDAEREPLCDDCYDEQTRQYWEDCLGSGGFAETGIEDPLLKGTTC